MRALRCLRSTAAFCLLGLAVPAGAMAQQEVHQEVQSPVPPSLRLRLEVALGQLSSDSTQWHDGSQASPSCAPYLYACDLSPALGLGIDWSPLRYIGLGLRGRWVHQLASTSIFGRHLDVLEVLSVPQVNLPWKWRRFPRRGARPYVALPLGVAWSFQSRSWTRAVNEDWNSHPGLSAGVAVGLEMYWTARWGSLVELGYQARFLSADVVSTPVDEPQAQASEHVTTRQHQIIFSVGLLFGLLR
jgi:hypothetical protein